MRRQTTLGIGLAAVIVASGIGWFAGRQIQSPAEIAARTAPPKASLIAVPVEERTLSSEVVVRGTVRFGAPQSVSLPTSPLKPGKSIVSTAPVKGAELTDGAVAFTVSGRPVFVMEGAQPAYRDMAPGTVGTDVQQLEAGLLRYGFDPGPIDGVYDQQTEAAVAAWYQSAGYSPFGPTDEQLAASSTAQGDHFGAQTDLLTAKEEPRHGPGPAGHRTAAGRGGAGGRGRGARRRGRGPGDLPAGQGRGAGRRHHQDQHGPDRHGGARRGAEGAGRRPGGEAEAHPGGAGRARGRRPGG